MCVLFAMFYADSVIILFGMQCFVCVVHGEQARLNDDLSQMLKTICKRTCLPCTSHTHARTHTLKHTHTLTQTHKTRTHKQYTTRTNIHKQSRTQVSSDETERLIKMEEVLHGRVIGQEVCVCVFVCFCVLFCLCECLLHCA